MALSRTLSVGATVVDCTQTLLLGIAVVAFWRGTWLIIDAYTCGVDTFAGFCAADPGVHRDSGAYSAAAGVAVFLLVVRLRRFVQARLQPAEKHGSAQSPALQLERLYTYVLLWATVAVWHGAWYLADAAVMPHNGGAPIDRSDHVLDTAWW
jgi:hypothetical protein